MTGRMAVSDWGEARAKERGRRVAGVWRDTVIGAAIAGVALGVAARADAPGVRWALLAVGLVAAGFFNDSTAFSTVANSNGVFGHQTQTGLDFTCTVRTADGRAAGITLHVLGEGTEDGVGAVHARAVVLATGGMGQVFSSTTNTSVSTGDGVALALRAGAADRAAAYFARLPASGSGPITLSRTHYWRGRAAEAAGDAAGGRASYAEAARHLLVGFLDTAHVAPEPVLVHLLRRLGVPQAAIVRADLVGQHQAHVLVLPQPAELQLEIHQRDADAQE